MTKEELMSMLKSFEYETWHSRMRIVEFHDTYVVCMTEELVFSASPWDPADVDCDVDVVITKHSLLDIANAIDEMPSAYWHSVALDINAWYYAHLKTDEFVKSEECLDFMLEHFKDDPTTFFKDGLELTKRIFYAYQQLYKVQQEIKQINTELDMEPEEDLVHLLCNALNQLMGQEDNLKWGLESLLNK